MDRHEAEKQIRELAAEANISVLIVQPLAIAQGHVSTAWRSMIEARQITLAAGHTELLTPLNHYIDAAQKLLTEFDKLLFPDDTLEFEEDPEPKPS